MALDLLNLEEVKISSDLSGKIILIYSTNNQGKSKVASQLYPKQTLFVSTEKGYNGLGGIKKVDVANWRTFRDVVSSLTPKKKEDADKIKEMYKCIVVDVADRLPDMAQAYICAKNNVENISDIPWGGGYAQLKTEFNNQLTKLTLSGFCLILICHEVTKEVTNEVTGETYMYTQPRSTDTKVGEVLKDIPDFTIYLENRGADENGNVILSRGHLTQHKNFFARSRFTQCPPTIDPFTAIGLRETIKTACEREAELLGVECVNNEELIEQQLRELQANQRTREQVIKEIRDVANALIESNNKEEAFEVVEKYLGEGVNITQTTDGQIDKLEYILNDLIDMAESKGISW